MRILFDAAVIGRAEKFAGHTAEADHEWSLSNGPVLPAFRRKIAVIQKTIPVSRASGRWADGDRNRLSFDVNGAAHLLILRLCQVIFDVNPDRRSLPEG